LADEQFIFEGRKHNAYSARNAEFGKDIIGRHVQPAHAHVYFGVCPLGTVACPHGDLGVERDPDKASSIGWAVCYVHLAVRWRDITDDLKYISGFLFPSIGGTLLFPIINLRRKTPSLQGGEDVKPRSSQERSGARFPCIFTVQTYVLFDIPPGFW